MPVELVFTSTPIQQRDPRLARQFEQAVADALGGHEDAAAPGPVHVRFSVWEGDDVPRYVCKVECASVCTMEQGEPAWRWWSRLVETPLELGQELREAARARRAAVRGSARPSQEPARPVERWGWAGELTLSETAMAGFDTRSPQAVEQLIAETRALIETNRDLQARLRGRRFWQLASVTLAAMLAFYAWSIHRLLGENLLLLRTNTDLVESGNAMLRSSSTRQQELQSALKQMKRPPAAAPERPRRRPETCAGQAPGCDSSTYWVPGFPGPRASTKRTHLRAAS